jgi:hypothetical protein
VQNATVAQIESTIRCLVPAHGARTVDVWMSPVPFPFLTKCLVHRSKVVVGLVVGNSKALAPSVESIDGA